MRHGMGASGGSTRTAPALAERSSGGTGPAARRVNCKYNGVQLMIRKTAPIAASIILATTIPALSAAAAGETEAKPADPVVALVGRLDLEKYKATIKGLTRFDDRRHGTDRNRDAIDWI